MTELSITIKDSERSLTKKEDIPDGLFIHPTSPGLVEKIQHAMFEFSGNIEVEAPTIVVKTKTIIQ